MQKTAAAMAHETIHSGHFMTSDPHTDTQDADEEDGELEVDVVEDDEKPEENSLASKDHGTVGTAFGTRPKTHCFSLQDDKPVTFYKFGPKKMNTIAIDVSLNKLKKCIKVAYNKMTTPKWKDFKGIKLHWKARIRLNNVIWRAYYIEFGKKNRRQRAAAGQKKTPFCYFSVPDEDTTHTKIEGSVMEGMYWKRGMPAVCAQYKRWRYYGRHKKNHDRPHGALREKRKRNLSGPDNLKLAPPEKIQRSMTPPNLSTHFEFDDFENYFTDSLFDSLSQPYLFPDRDFFGNGSNADIMQPGLLPLQPSLEEIMASLEDDTPLDSDSRCSPMLASQATEHIAGPSSIPTQAPPAVMAPPPMAPQPRLSTLAAPRPAQDYAVASINQSLSSAVNMPTRQPSSITSQMLMLSSQSIPPQYSTASYSGGSWKPPLFGSDPSSSSGLDTPYVPQYLQTQTGLIQGSHHVLQSSITSMRSNWWLDSPLAVASPLSVGTTPLNTPLNPSTPLGLGLSPTTPPQFRTELRSPVVRTTADPNCMLNSLSNVDSTALKSSLTHRLEQPSLLNSRLENKPEIPQPWLRPTPSTAANLGFPSGPPRTAPASAPVRQMNEENPWKITNLQPVAPLYRNFVSTPATPIDESQASSSSSSRLLNMMDTSPGDPTVKQEEGMLSAPSSVKPPKGGSRQVQADSTMHPEERKRILHLYAEQNRRSALKDGFEQLMEMIPDLYSGGIKPTNAVVLAKSAEHIRRMVNQKADQLEIKMELQERIAKLNKKIATAQANMPSNTGMVSGQVEPKAALETFHDGYVKERSRRDFRFWVMARLLQPLTVGQSNSFAAALAGEASREELSARCSEWMRVHWKGPELRPLASNMLVHLATNTDMLSDPASLQDYVKDQLKQPI